MQACLRRKTSLHAEITWKEEDNKNDASMKEVSRPGSKSVKSLAEIGQAQAVGGVYCKSCPTFLRWHELTKSYIVPTFRYLHSLDPLDAMRHCVKVRLLVGIITIFFDPAGAHDVTTHKTLYRRPRGLCVLAVAAFVASDPTLLERLQPLLTLFRFFLTFDAAKFKIANFPSRYLKFRGLI